MLFLASAAFGLEGLVKRDLIRLGAGEIAPQNTGGVLFSGDPALGFAANLWLRTADRVLAVAGRFEARSFEALFDQTAAIPWEDYLPRDAAFPIKAHCARSQLMSPSDCQSIVKKAVAERLKKVYHLDWLPETGAVCEIDVSVHGDLVTLGLNMSGPALSRRGYRTWNGEAPLRETLAAAMALCAPWRPNMPLYDPCCGTGTILIEAAFIALDRAPGLTRAFDCEQWSFMPKPEMERIRAEAKSRFEAGLARPLMVSGSDMDPEAIALAQKHIRQAGLAGRVEVCVKDMRNVTLPPGPGAILANPPYGERLGDKKAARVVARILGELAARAPGWSLSALTGDRGFEAACGRRAQKRRRVYNGRLECELLTFDGRNPS